MKRCNLKTNLCFLFSEQIQTNRRYCSSSDLLFPTICTLMGRDWYFEKKQFWYFLWKLAHVLKILLSCLVTYRVKKIIFEAFIWFEKYVLIVISMVSWFEPATIFCQCVSLISHNNYTADIWIFIIIKSGWYIFFFICF